MSNAHRALDNFSWRISSIVPTNIECRARFRWGDPMRVDPEASAGTARMFSVKWTGSESAHDVEDKIKRWAWHEFEVAIAYPTEMELLKRQRVMLQDRDDIIAVLRNSDYVTGYSNHNSSDDIGIEDREFLEDETEDETEFTTIMRQRWRVLISETE